MRGYHIAFLNVPRRPHVNPTLPIVSTLVRRGNRVTYVTSDLFESKIAALGAEVIRCQRVPLFGPSKYANPFIELAVRSLERLEHSYRSDTPDLVIYDGLFFAGRILAKRWKVPAIQTTPCLDSDNALDYSNQIAESAEFADFLTFLRDQHVPEYFPSTPLPYREDLNIFFYPQSFQVNSSAFDESCFYAARCVGEQPPEGFWAPSSLHRPIVLVAMSSTYRREPAYFREIISGLEGLGWYVVLSVGEENDRSYFDPLPDHFETIQNVSHEQVLRHADLLVYMGGMIATVEAAYYGVPSIIIKHDEFPEIVRYGSVPTSVGIASWVINAEGFAGELRTTATRVIQDAAMRANVKKIQLEVRRGAGAEETANRIEAYLEQGADKRN